MEQKLAYLKVEALKESPWNRAADGNGEMEELVQSIKLHGILQPLIVRDQGEIVAGHRRWRAAKAAGLKEVPCIMVKLSDNDAKVTQITENLMRKNLGAMEEALAFEQLIDAAEGKIGRTHQEIADMVGKEVKYIYRALELLKLPMAAQKAIEKGHLTAAHGHQLARADGKQQDSMLKYALAPDYHGNCPTVQDLKTYVLQRVGKRLSAAPWDKQCEYAGKVACAKCPYDSGNQDSLFDGAEDGLCTNGACFNVKLNQWYKDLRAKGENRWPTLKFIGTASSAYGETQVIKGYQVVEETAGVKKAIAPEPDGDPDYQVKGYGFGILKPSNWGSLKTAKLVIVKKLPEGAQEEGNRRGYQEPTPEERAHSWYVWGMVRKLMQPMETEMLRKRKAFEKSAEAEWKKNKEKITALYLKEQKELAS